MILPTMTSLGGLSAVTTAKPSPFPRKAFSAVTGEAAAVASQVMASWACTNTHVSPQFAAQGIADLSFPRGAILDRWHAPAEALGA